MKISTVFLGSLLLASSLAFANPWRGNGQNSDIGNDGGAAAFNNPNAFRGGERASDSWHGNGENSDIGNDGGAAAFNNPFRFRGGERASDSWHGNGENSDIPGPSLTDGIAYAQDRAGYLYAGPSRKGALENCMTNSRARRCKLVRRVR